jgi:hypothetical protein
VNPVGGLDVRALDAGRHVDIVAEELVRGEAHRACGSTHNISTNVRYNCSSNCAVGEVEVTCPERANSAPYEGTNGKQSVDQHVLVTYNNKAYRYTDVYSLIKHITLHHKTRTCHRLAAVHRQRLSEQQSALIPMGAGTLRGRREVHGLRAAAEVQVEPARKAVHQCCGSRWVIYVTVSYVVQLAG